MRTTGLDTLTQLETQLARLCQDGKKQAAHVAFIRAMLDHEMGRLQLVSNQVDNLHLEIVAIKEARQQDRLAKLGFHQERMSVDPHFPDREISGSVAPI